MSMMNTELYDALVEAGASEDKARTAAASFAEDVIQLKAEIEKTNLASAHTKAGVAGEILFLKWALGAIFLAVVLPNIKNFFP